MASLKKIYLTVLFCSLCLHLSGQSLKKSATIYFYRLKKSGTSDQILKLKINDTLSIALTENSSYKLTYASAKLKMKISGINGINSIDTLNIKGGINYYFRFDYFSDRIDIQEVAEVMGQRDLQELEAQQKKALTKEKPTEYPVLKVSTMASVPGHYPDRSFIYIYRPPQNAGAAVSIRVQLPDSSVLYVNNNASYAFEVKPGVVELRTVHPENVHRNASLNLTIEKGRNYYIHLGFEKFAQIEMNLTDEETARLVMAK